MHPHKLGIVIICTKPLHPVSVQRLSLYQGYNRRLILGYPQDRVPLDSCSRFKMRGRTGGKFLIRLECTYNHSRGAVGTADDGDGCRFTAAKLRRLRLFRSGPVAFRKVLNAEFSYLRLGGKRIGHHGITSRIFHAIRGNRRSIQCLRLIVLYSQRKVISGDFLVNLFSPVRKLQIPLRGLPHTPGPSSVPEI